MAGDIVQFRADPEDLRYLRARGINPNEFARDAFRYYLPDVLAWIEASRTGGPKPRLPKEIEALLEQGGDRGGR